MEKIDFELEKKELHDRIYNEIIKLMKYYKVNEIDFTKDIYNNSYVVRSVSGAESTEEVKVTKVRLTNDNYLEYQTDVYHEENEWYSLDSFGDVLLCTISGLYDCIYDKLAKK